MKFVVADLDDASPQMAEHLAPYMPDDLDIEWAYTAYFRDGEDKFFEICEDADVIFNGYYQWDRDSLARLKNCKCISIPATGYNTVDVDAAAEFGIPVTNVHEYCTEEVSDHTIMLMLALQRGLMAFQKDVQVDHGWHYNACPHPHVINGETLGIFGCGKIGMSVAKKAKALGMNVIAYDPYSEKSFGRTMGITYTEDRDEIFKNADVITLHMNLTDETTGFITYDDFKKMAKKPIFLNCARGAMVVEDDLIRALDEGLIESAGLDVLESETPDPATHPLIGRDNVIVTPHAAFFSDLSNEKLLKIGAENAAHVVKGEYDKAFKIVNGVTSK